MPAMPSTPPTFPLLTTIPPPSSLKTTPPFTVSLPRGFLPLSHPPEDLPPAFAKLTSLLERMPIRTKDGGKGLLAEFKLGEAVVGELEDLSGVVDQFKDDLPVCGALYRDYSFLASAYLLEPCYERLMKGKEEGKEEGKEVGMGVGRERLPAVLAKPLARVAAVSGFKPFMEYAGSYALFNYRLHEPVPGMDYDNLRLIRAFEHGLDPASSEAGFVLVHVEMVKHSGRLVRGAVDTLRGCAEGERELFEEGLRELVGGMAEVNDVMEGMWKKSKPRDYNNFRTFIFGITNQSMFPNGVVYEGVSEEPMSFRGESGANDSMIPLCDNLLEIEMPDTPLTEILKDFRSYRPGNHREFLEWVRDRARDVEVKAFAMKEKTSAVLYLHALNQVRDFRWRHWCFTREYILKKTAHPTATGGSPIVLWLPNQLFSVYDHMIEVERAHGHLSGCEKILELVYSQRRRLEKEVEKYCAERGV